MSYVDRSDTKMYSAGTMLGLVGGYLLTRVIGPVGWIPVVLGFGSFALLNKLVNRNAAVIAALAGLIAQTGWFAVGAIAVPDQAGNVIIDLVVNTILIAAIFFRPGYVSAGIAVAWNLLGIGVLAMEYSAGAPGMERAMLAHLVLRVVILAAAVMIMVYRANPDLLPDREDEAEEAYQ